METLHSTELSVSSFPVINFVAVELVCEFPYKLIYCMYNSLKGVIIMPNIKSISDLRNYTEVLKEVDTASRVYLARNGHGEYGRLSVLYILQA